MLPHQVWSGRTSREGQPVRPQLRVGRVRVLLGDFLLPLAGRALPDVSANVLARHAVLGVGTFGASS